MFARVFPERNTIQIAGVTDQLEADMIAACGVGLLGFPLRITSGDEDLGESDARDIISRLQPAVCGVVITYLTDARSVRKLCSDVGAEIVQLHADVPLETLVMLKKSMPGLRIIKSLIVRGNNLSALRSLIDRASPYVDAFITDTLDPESGARGATGKTHNWAISRHLVEHSPHPVILAGGLNPGNVRDAIHKVGPAGVDAHTGVEGRDGRKERALVERFVAEARAGFDTLWHGYPNRGPKR
jgi:phosphoribosylanthranilate isomerase